MKDIIAKYKKHTFFQTSAIVITSLAIALWVNMYVMDGEIWKYLKSSVLDINGVEQTADIYGKVSPSRDMIILGTQKPMNQVTNISLSLIFDDETVEIGAIESMISGSEIMSLSNESGVKTILVSFSEPLTLTGESDFLKIPVTKSGTATAYLNILNANFKDSSEKDFLLSTSGVLF